MCVVFVVKFLTVLVLTVLVLKKTDCNFICSFSDLNEDTDTYDYVIPDSYDVTYASGTLNVDKVTMATGFGSDNTVQLYLRVKDQAGAISTCPIGSVRVRILARNNLRSTAVLDVCF